MRVKLLIAIGIAFILISALIPNVRADTEIMVPEKTETNVLPIIFGNLSLSDRYEAPKAMCVSNDGTIFVVSLNPWWQNVRGLSPASFVAWNPNGSVRWAQRFSTFDRVLLGVEVDNSHVFVTGGISHSFYLAKYDFQGNNIWNVTKSIGNISYGVELGFKMSLLDDGTIIVGVVSENYSKPHHYDYFLAAFNQEGDIQWSEIIEDYMSHCCDSNFIYIGTNNTLQKRDSRGSILWTKQAYGCRPGLASNDRLYSIVNSGTILCTSLNIKTLNKVTGEKIWSSNFRICNNDHQVYNSSGRDCVLTQDGSLMVLTHAIEVSTWYLETINQDGVLISHTNLLNNTWGHSQLNLGVDGNLIYVASYNHNYGLLLAAFNSSQLCPFYQATTDEVLTNPFLSDVQLIGIVTIGVIGFDVAFIIFLRKEY
jgi:hypothetical protein